MHLLYNVEPRPSWGRGITWELVYTSSKPRQDTDVFQFTYRILKKNIRDPWIRVMRSRVMVTGRKSGWWFCESQLESGNQGEIAERERNMPLIYFYYLTSIFFSERPWLTKWREWRRQTYKSHMVTVRCQTLSLSNLLNSQSRDASPVRLSIRGFRLFQLPKHPAFIVFMDFPSVSSWPHYYVSNPLKRSSGPIMHKI